VKDIHEYELYYFLGIGGIGVSALARYFSHLEKKCAGYDRQSSPLTDALIREGIECHFDDDVKALQEIAAHYEKENVLVIYTPAVPPALAELRYLKEQGYRFLKRAEALGMITSRGKTFAIAGTHGKTTTTTLLAHILKTAGKNVCAFMGGISLNYSGNLLLPADEDEVIFVVEADEYDRSFLHLHPFGAVITSNDPDHLDVYGEQQQVKKSFAEFASLVNEKGILVVKKNVENDLTAKGKAHIYSLNLDTEYRAENLRLTDGLYQFELRGPAETISGLTLGIPGLHNVENAVAAATLARLAGTEEEAIRTALRSFKGVKRRFEIRLRTERMIYIDDYAHHPAEIRAAVRSAREMFPAMKITGIFQPHLFSRTRDFGDDFAESLGLLDECILMEIYPAREKPIEGIDAHWLLEKIRLERKSVLREKELMERLEEYTSGLLITMGAGDIDRLADPIEKLLRKKVEENKL
jgi:UDP-N-acetylmuramate--alanine ligase